MKYIEPNPGIDGWMNGTELQWLFEKASEMEKIVEVGSWMGKSTHALLSGCKGFVYAVDHFKGNASEIEGAHIRAKTEDIHAIFQRNVGYFDNLVTMKIDSREAAKHFKEKEIDMVFLDGDHEYSEVKADIEAWFPKCRKLFCGHDMRQQGVPQALVDCKIEKVYQIPNTSIWSIEI